MLLKNKQKEGLFDPINYVGQILLTHKNNKIDRMGHISYLSFESMSPEARSISLFIDRRENNR